MDLETSFELAYGRSERGDELWGRCVSLSLSERGGGGTYDDVIRTFLEERLQVGAQGGRSEAHWRREDRK